MPQFEGNKLKVRCVDCTSLSGNHCSVKNTKVAPKKRRVCGVYQFKGEFENRSPEVVPYVPHVDKKTRKMIQKLLNMGTVPVVGKEGERSVEVTGGEGFAKVKTFPTPSTTALISDVSELKSEQLEDPLIYKTLDKEPKNSNELEIKDGTEDGGGRRSW